MHDFLPVLIFRFFFMLLPYFLPIILYRFSSKYARVSVAYVGAILVLIAMSGHS